MITSDIIEKYFPELSVEKRQKFKMLAELYPQWNEMINVISRKDIDFLFLHHVLHSLAIAKVIRFVTGTNLIDVGTGGGFPGIPLAILFDDCKFHLVDSVGKKITVVNGIIESLDLKNVTAEKARVEELKGEYDFVISRAVTTLKEMQNWTRHLIKKEGKNILKNGILYLKGGDLKEEIKDLYKKDVSIFELKDIFEEGFFETKKLVHVPF